MKISVSQNFTHKMDSPTSIQSAGIPKTLPPSPAKSYAQVPFYGLPHLPSQKYYSALNYLNKVKRGSDKTDDIALKNLNLTKLEGLQDGIKVFAGLSMKEIAFVFNKPHFLLASRTCNNMCEHCYADAPGIISKKSTFVKNASMEDFTSFVDGTAELEKRLGFKLLGRKEKDCLAFVYDSDNMLVELSDKIGKNYDFTDLTELLYNKIKTKSLFDTAGWVPSSQKMQQRAEKIVAYLAKDDNYKKTHQINISVHPFHEVMTISRKYEEMGNVEKALEKRELYTDRMANTLFTFTPVLDKPNFNILQNALENASWAKKGCRVDDLKLLDSEIFEKLKQKYAEDLSGEQKFIKTPSQIEHYTKILDKKFEKIRIADPLGKGRTFFPKKTQEEFLKTREKSLFLIEAFDSKKTTFLNLIDVNGNCFQTNNDILVPTAVKLNYSNKRIPAVPFKEVSETKIDKYIINRDY